MGFSRCVGQEVLARSMKSALRRSHPAVPFETAVSNLPAALGKTGTQSVPSCPKGSRKTKARSRYQKWWQWPLPLLGRRANGRCTRRLCTVSKNTSRPGGVLSRSAGAKSHISRVEWTVIPIRPLRPPANGGRSRLVDVTNNDLAPMMKRNRAIKVRHFQDSNVAIMRFIWLQPHSTSRYSQGHSWCRQPRGFYDRRHGTDPAAWRTGVATSNRIPQWRAEGLEALTGPRDLAKVKRDLVAAGYAGERVVVLSPTTIPH